MAMGIQAINSSLLDTKHAWKDIWIMKLSNEGQPQYITHH